MSKSEIFKYLIESNTSISIYQIILSMMVSLVLAMAMYCIYKKTYTGVVYSKGFNQTLVLVTLIITMVMAVIGGNLALSLGMVGSLSVIRFRTAIKEPKDMAFLFWAIAIGLSCGAEMYVVAVVGSVVIALVLIFFKQGAYDINSYLIVVRGKNIIDRELENILNDNTKKWRIRMKNSSAEHDELTYEISLKNVSAAELTEQFHRLNYIETVNIVTYTGEVVG